MRALTLFDPWATLVVLGEKHYESRSWGTSHRGLLAIHVSKTLPKVAQQCFGVEPFMSALLEHFPGEGSVPLYPGCIIGTVEVMECEQTIFGGVSENDSDRRGYRVRLSSNELAFGDFSDGRYAWKLTNPRRLATPIPCAGHQRLWIVPPEIEATLKEM